MISIQRIAAIYKHYASAISVLLTDEKYFQGHDFLPSSPNRPAADFM